MTHLTRISDALREDGALEYALDAFSAAVLFVDAEGVVRMATSALKTFFDIDPDSIVDKHLGDFVEPISRNFTEYMSFHEIFGVPIQDREKEFLKDAEVSLPMRRFLQFTSRPVMVKEEWRGRIWMMRDITKEREITELKIEYGGVRSADELKSRFMTVIAHQLRTPLNSMRWNSELLMTDYEIQDEALEIVRQVYSGVVRSISIVDDMLLAAEIERRSLKLDKATADIGEIVRKVVRDHKRSADMKSVKLEVKEMPEGLPSLFLDQAKIEVALGRIVDNAVTYSLEGRSVEVGVRLGEKDVTIEVTDHGVGIPESERNHVFEKFYRAKEAIKLNPNASGLGLYITKYIVEAHDGKVDFISEEGRGTKFMMMLPRKAA